MIRAWLLGCVLLLSACVSQAPLPQAMPQLHLPLQLHIQRQQGDQRQDWLLVVQQEAGGLRWSMMDPLGIPLARQKLVNDKWQADGLLPPNPEARELFAALLFALTTNSQLLASYPSAQHQGTHRRFEARWAVKYQSADVFALRVQTGKDGEQLTYRVSPLNNEVTP